MKVKILFVDEDKAALEALERVLFKMRSDWIMEFATSSEDALRMMEENTYDALVADINIPAISGVELFNIARENNPEAARIIISGNTEMKQLVEALGTAHQFLSKPVDAVVLKSAILKVMTLRNYLKDEQLHKIVNKIEALPPHPELHLELLHAIASTSVNKIVNIIKRDVGLTVRLLHLVNSPFMGIRTQVDSIYRAVNLLGMEMLQALVLSLEIFNQFPLMGKSKQELTRLFDHSTDVADYARLIAMEITGDKKIANDSYIAGMIHDVGKLVILSSFGDTYFRIQDYIREAGTLSYIAEQDFLGIDHTKLGAYLLGLWGLPEILVGAAAYHHFPEDFFETSFSPITAVHIADTIKHSEVRGLSTSGLPLGLNIAYLDGMRINLLEKIPRFIGSISSLKDARFPLSSTPLP